MNKDEESKHHPLVGSWHMEFCNHGNRIQVEYRFHNDGTGVECIQFLKSPIEQEENSFCWEAMGKKLSLTYLSIEKGISMTFSVKGRRCVMRRIQPPWETMHLIKKVIQPTVLS
ncbi:MAG: hypothetical protein MI717_08095 [Spirochaetales bacterium]|nr:hypothetical protein [Spirochaetales bacterium]